MPTLRRDAWTGAGRGGSCAERVSWWEYCDEEWQELSVLAGRVGSLVLRTGTGEVEEEDDWK